MAQGFKIRIDSRDIERLVRQYPDASRDARVRRISEALLLLEAEVKEDTPYGAGPIHLRDTIHAQPAQVSGKRVWGVMGTPAEHGVPVEMGTKPHFPPIDPLQFWAEQVLGVDTSVSRGVAWAIAIKISKKGTKGAHMFEANFEDNRGRVEAILARIPDDIVRMARGA